MTTFTRSHRRRYFVAGLLKVEDTRDGEVRWVLQVYDWDQARVRYVELSDTALDHLTLVHERDSPTDG